MAYDFQAATFEHICFKADHSGRCAVCVLKNAGVKLELHAPTVERMRESYAKRGMELNDARLRMVRV